MLSSYVLLSFSGTVESACYVAICLQSECGGLFCYRCKDGYYLPKQFEISHEYCKVCPSSCASCNGYKDCPKCNTGHYGYLCRSNCTELCKDSICDKELGSCTNGCIDGFYQKPDNTCSQCPSKCSNCSSVDSCYECVNVNYWGATCQFTCDHCLSCSKSDGCSSDCTDGFYQSYNAKNGGYECKECPWNCIDCAADNYCQSCRLGHWVQPVKTCVHSIVTTEHVKNLLVIVRMDVMMAI